LPLIAIGIVHLKLLMGFDNILERRKEHMPVHTNTQLEEPRYPCWTTHWNGRRLKN